MSSSPTSASTTRGRALLDDLGLPAVTLNRAAAGTTATAVCVDDGPAVREAVHHLVGLGHRNIGHIGGPSTYLHATHRRQVWARALHDAGLPAGPVVEADFSAGGGAAATVEMLGADSPPTAILYANDLMAVAGVAAARQRGVLVPDHLSVVGFDDSQLSAYLTAPLTTVHTDVYGWGKAAATALLTRTEGQPVADIYLPAAQFVTRASTGPVPGRPRKQSARGTATR